jgi:hypothetical protein
MRGDSDQLSNNSRRAKTGQQKVMCEMVHKPIPPGVNSRPITLSDGSELYVAATCSRCGARVRAIDAEPLLDGGVRLFCTNHH